MKAPVREGSPVRPGDRILLLKRLAQALSTPEMTWSDLRLTLRQFGVPTMPALGAEGMYDYALRHLETADDARLLDLLDFLCPSESAPAQPAEAAAPAETAETAAPAPESPLRVFITHPPADRTKVAQLAAHLAAFGVEVVGGSLEALEQAHAVAAFLTPTFHQSPWADQELGYSLALRLPVVAITVGQEPYGHLAGVPKVAGWGVTVEQIALGLFEALAREPATRLRASQALISRLLSAQTPVDARRAGQALGRLTAWSVPLLRALEEGVRQSRVLQQSPGVPEAIRTALTHGQRQIG